MKTKKKPAVGAGGFKEAESYGDLVPQQYYNTIAGPRRRDGARDLMIAVLEDGNRHSERRRCDRPLNPKNSRDLPTPASAIAATIWPRPAFACCAARFMAGFGVLSRLFHTPNSAVTAPCFSFVRQALIISAVGPPIFHLVRRIPR